MSGIPISTGIGITLNLMKTYIIKLKYWKQMRDAHLVKKPVTMMLGLLGLITEIIIKL